MHKQESPATAVKVIRWPGFAEMYGTSVGTLRRIEKEEREKEDSRFPKKIPLSAQAVGFLLSDIEAFIESRKGVCQ